MLSPQSPKPPPPLVHSIGYSFAPRRQSPLLLIGATAAATCVATAWAILLAENVVGVAADASQWWDVRDVVLPVCVFGTPLLAFAVFVGAFLARLGSIRPQAAVRWAVVVSVFALTADLAVLVRSWPHVNPGYGS